MKKKLTRIQAIVHVSSWLPFLILLWNLLSNNLGANPIQTITTYTGRTALNLLFFTLLCTPLNSVGITSALLVRRALGLYSFLYTLLHFLTFTILDYGFQISEIAYLIFHQIFLFLGLIAFILLIALTITSTAYWIRRMGIWWKRLHQLIYAIGILVVVHFYLAVKLDTRLPIFYFLLYTILMVLRIPFLKGKKEIPQAIEKIDGFLSTDCV